MNTLTDDKLKLLQAVNRFRKQMAKITQDKNAKASPSFISDIMAARSELENSCNFLYNKSIYNWFDKTIGDFVCLEYKYLTDVSVKFVIRTVYIDDGRVAIDKCSRYDILHYTEIFNSKEEAQLYYELNK